MKLEKLKNELESIKNSSIKDVRDSFTEKDYDLLEVIKLVHEAYNIINEFAPGFDVWLDKYNQFDSQV